MICKASFDPKIIWELPEGDVPISRMMLQREQNILYWRHEARKLYHFIKGGNPTLNQNKREMMFVQMLEGLHQG